jgi:RES domain-containing protein
MIVYRVGKSRYASDLTGEGARLNGGRWNNIGVPCLYTSVSRALAVLEYTVNVNIQNVPRALSITVFEIPDHGIQVISEADLPGNWKTVPAPSSTKDFGDQLLNSAAQPVIQIPSSVIRDEYNFLLNPRHPNFYEVTILEIKDFVYDVRIKQV